MVCLQKRGAFHFAEKSALATAFTDARCALKNIVTHKVAARTCASKSRHIPSICRATVTWAEGAS